VRAGTFRLAAAATGAFRVAAGDGMSAASSSNWKASENLPNIQPERECRSGVYPSLAWTEA